MAKNRLFVRKDSGEGIVCSVRGRQVVVAPLTPPDAGLLAPPREKACAAANACGGGCAGCASLRDGRGGKIRLYVKSPQNVRAGDRVAFDRFVPEPGAAGVLVFGFTAALVVAVMCLWQAGAPREAESPLAALSAAAAFFGGFAILGALDALFRKKYPADISVCGNAPDEKKRADAAGELKERAP